MNTREPIRAIRLNDGTFYVPGDVTRRADRVVTVRSGWTPARTGAVTAGAVVGVGTLTGVAWAVTQLVAWVIANGVLVLGGAVALVLLGVATTRPRRTCTVTITHRH